VSGGQWVVRSAKWVVLIVLIGEYLRRPFVGYPSLALPRSWSHFVGNCCDKLTNLIEFDF